MNYRDSRITLLSSPWQEALYSLVDEAREELTIATPFISEKPLRAIAEITQRKSSPTFRINVVTNLAVDSLLSGSLDVNALLHFSKSVPRTEVTYLPGLHAKIYIADDRSAIVTSGNLTNGGLAANYEYGVLLRTPELVKQARTDLSAYTALGNVVSIETLTTLSTVASQLKGLRRREESDLNAQLRAAFEERVEDARVELLRARARGKTTTGIFRDTILYLLAQNGPLRTVDLHPRIQQIHPDICDDTMERVIEGVHFGKLWKHHVRNAQQALQRNGQIGFDGSVWSLRR